MATIANNGTTRFTTGTRRRAETATPHSRAPSSSQSASAPFLLRHQPRIHQFDHLATEHTPVDPQKQGKGERREERAHQIQRRQQKVNREPLAHKGKRVREPSRDGPGNRGGSSGSIRTRRSRVISKSSPRIRETGFETSEPTRRP